LGWLARLYLKTLAQWKICGKDVQIGATAVKISTHNPTHKKYVLYYDTIPISENSPAPLANHCDRDPGFTEHAVGSENAEVTMIRRIMVAPTMSSPFAVLFTLAASTIRSRDALQSEILALLTLTGRFLKQCARHLRPNSPTNGYGFCYRDSGRVAPWSADRSIREGGHRLVI